MYLQLQFKRSHVLLIGLIEIYGMTRTVAFVILQIIVEDFKEILHNLYDKTVQAAANSIKRYVLIVQ